MLILTRGVNERIRIGDDIVIVVVEVVHRNRVRLGIEAPRGVKIMRTELIDKAPRDEGAAS